MIRRLHRRAALALAATGGLALLATGLSSPASAGTNCPYRHHCVFWGDFNTSSHAFFDPDPDFSDNVFTVDRGDSGYLAPVNDNFWSASNSSSTNTESHYWLHAQGWSGNVRLFCVNPGQDATADEVLAVNARDKGSSLTMPGRTSVHCI